MKIGDLVVCKNRYKGQYFLVTQMRNTKLNSQRTLIRCYNRKHRTRWCDAATWEVVSESR